MAKKSTKKIVKKQSVKEFKAWLEGITEFQPVGWCPSAEQWNTIKEKIGNLQDEIIVKENVIMKESPQGFPSQTNQPRRAVSSLMNVEPTDNTVEPLRVVPAGKIELFPEDGGPPEFIDIPVEVNSNGQPMMQTVSSQVLATGSRIKTPHSKSGDKSPFA